MQELTSFQRDLLHILAGLDQPHGLAVKKEMDKYYQVDLNNGRLYPNLDTLDEKGLIEKRSVDNRTNNYEITDKGLAAIDRRYRWEKNYYHPTPQVPEAHSD